MRPHLCKGCGGEIWRPEPTPQQGAAPVSARECAEWLVGERGTHAVDDASALIDAYAERVAEERMAEATKEVEELRGRIAVAAEPTPTPEVVNATVCPACGSPVVVESSRGGSTHHYRPVGHVADLRAEVARLTAERDALRAALQQCIDYERMNAGKYDEKYGAGAGRVDLHIERAIIALAGPPPAATDGPA